MASSCLHLQHLSQILQSVAGGPAPSSSPEAAVRSFFDSLATASISTNGRSWQRKPLIGLLWHYPDLVPSASEAVAVFVKARWHAYRTDQEMETAGPLPEKEIDAGDMTTDGSWDACSSPVSVPSEAMPADRPAPDCFTGFQGREPDWFDRFTDWVAAVVSLFKR